MRNYELGKETGKCDLYSGIKDVKRDHLYVSPDVGFSQQRIQTATINVLGYLTETKFKELKYDNSKSTNRGSQ